MTETRWRRWDVAWESALYGPQGFYRRHAPADHFATSAQGLGTAGDVLAEALLALATRHDLHRIVDVAAGRGELLAALAHRAPAGFDLVGVDVVARPPDLPERITWLGSPGGAALPPTLTGLADTLLLAHEWLDVVPCPVAVRSGGRWTHVLVDEDGAERLGPPVDGPEMAWLGQHISEDVIRAEVGLSRDTAYADLVARVDRGLVVAVDYGHTHQTRPAEGTLTGYRNGTQVPPVPDGSCDLTAHVAVDTLGAGTLHTQREVLHDLLGRPLLPGHDLARVDGTAYLGQLARANALATLTARAGLGGFWWASTLCWRRGLG